MNEIKLKLEVELAELKLKIHKAEVESISDPLWDDQYTYPRELLGEQIIAMKEYAYYLDQRISLL